ncbi:winged helix-turn-helix domain-containing protein [Piscinibacter defluvii]|uniref:winged helix-turn-helix domain-containing protein n=1 Tax=Piscinibacter defluvii TaxID=1796922 RepID=UPI000FDD21FD|nr:winged helix-turn-helix domain-containing protein [Piscinibacter defluvii]
MTQRYRFGEFEVCPTERLLRREAAAVNVGARAFELLLALIEGRDRLLSKQELLERVWPSLDVEENNLATQVSTLRRILGQAAIVTAPGLGYRFAASVEVVDETLPHAGQESSEPTLRLGGLEWRPAQRAALLHGKALELGSRAIDLLGALIEERHRVVSKRELIARVWPGLVVEENNLQVQISTLRGKLGQSAIATIPGRGYRFTLSDAAVTAAAPPSETPAAPVQRRLTNLPLAAEALVGRGDDLEVLSRLVDSNRLVTLTGAGGMGKTSLAQALGRTLLKRFLDGVWWVDLAALSAPGEVVPAVAAAARLQLGGGDEASHLAQALETHDTLIILDNCEHLVERAAQIASSILQATERLHLLTTSQEPLRVTGERVYQLGPLLLPPAGAPPDEARRCGALALLERRAQATEVRFTIGDEVLPAAIDMCRQLDGIPLAIEMAAARLPRVGFAALQRGVCERLEWLRSGLRQAPARQQTLYAALDWSHSLLCPAEQIVLRRLTVFSGSFVLESAQQVATDHAIDAWDVAEAMAILVERSLIQVDGSDPPRYRLLETMRLYAGAELVKHGEVESTRGKHMHVMAALGSAAEEQYWITPDDDWLGRYAPEYDDLHAAFGWACAVRDSSAAAQTLDALYRLDELRELVQALEPRLKLAHPLASSVTPGAAIRIDLAVSSLFAVFAPLGGVAKLNAARHAVECARTLSDARLLYRALLAKALHATVSGSNREAAAALTEANVVEDPAWPARLLWFGAIHRTFVAALRDDAPERLRWSSAELNYALRSGSPTQALNARLNVADATLMCGDAREAVRLGSECVADARAQGRTASLATGVTNLLGALVAAGELERAVVLSFEAIELGWAYQRIGAVLDHLGLLAAQRQHFEDSCRLVGSSDAWWTKLQYRREGNEAVAVARAMAINSEALGMEAAACLRATAGSIDDAEAKRLALTIFPPPMATALGPRLSRSGR